MAFLQPLALCSSSYSCYRCSHASGRVMLEVEQRGPITRIHLGRALFGFSVKTVSLYLVDGLLIDSGPSVVVFELLAALRGLQVEQIFNTHHHEDHCGGNRALMERLGLPVLAAGPTAKLLAELPPIHRYRQWVWGQPDNVVATVVGSTLETEKYSFKVIATPGHSSDHFVLFEPTQGWLFSGDLFLHERVRYARPEENMTELAASLRLAWDLDPKLLVCAHTGFVLAGRTAIERKLNDWRRLAERALELSRDHSVREIRRRLLGPEGLLFFISGGHFSKTELIRSLVNMDPACFQPSG